MRLSRMYNLKKNETLYTFASPTLAREVCVTPGFAHQRRGLATSGPNEATFFSKSRWQRGEQGACSPFCLPEYGLAAL